MKNEQAAAAECGKFKIELRDVGKRVVVIPVHITLLEVHDVIQRVFDWEYSHLWEFQDGAGRRYGEKPEFRGPFGGDDEDLIPPTKVCLSDVLPERGCKLRYTYDFGDCWEHTITRMADPKTPGLYCVKTEGPDGIEDVGGSWGIYDYKDEWHVPGVEEITARLGSVQLKPRKQGTGLLRKESEALEALIRDLSDNEWEWLRQLGEEGMASSRRRSERISRLARLLPGVREMTRMAMLFGGQTYCAEPEFRRLWRKKREEWARLRGGETAASKAADALPKDLQNKICEFVCAAVGLYGAVGEEDLWALFEHWRNEKDWLKEVTRETAACAMELVRRDAYPLKSLAYYFKGVAVSSAKYPPNDFLEPEPGARLTKMLEARKGKPRWYPDTYAAFIDYAWSLPDMPPMYAKLAQFLMDLWKIDPKDIEKQDSKLLHALGDVYCAFATGGGRLAAIEELKDTFDLSILSSEDFSELATILKELFPATRLDPNWGFTPKEMDALHGHDGSADLPEETAEDELEFDAPIVRAEPKIGRNDPCPCGSGKKYKKCCGKDK